MTSEMNKRDFGSFHSSNVDELIALSDDSYVSPVIPIDLPTFDDDQLPSFGKDAMHKYYLLKGDVTFINHGAFGGVNKQSLQAAQKWQTYIEEEPVRFMDRELLPHLVFITRRMAKFVGCAATDLVLVPNVTMAMNCVLRSFNFQPEDEVLYFSTEYGANKKAISEICKKRRVTMTEQNITFPITDHNQLLDCLRTGFQKKTKLVILNHIASNIPFIMPIQQMVQICHDRNIKVLIDGAHAMGQLDLDIGKIAADFYATNCHKWLSGCKGTALLYVCKEYQDIIQPLVISHGYDAGFSSKFIWAGLKDYSAFLSLHTTLDLWTTLDPSRIREYIHNLAKQAGEVLVQSWKTELLVPSHMSGSMLCVKLPPELYANQSSINYEHAETLQNKLFYQFNIEVPIKVIDAGLYVRISAHIYNTIKDYHTLDSAVLSLLSTSHENNTKSE